mmetsp:Transcript_12544/g.31596  ORF Transcript_12544/g.31596 Transcript_12544/m.31596 type:complete len:485 (+) Transcript_12544:132-1586(+)
MSPMATRDSFDVETISKDWKSLKQRTGQGNPHPGCRQIIFRKMQLRLSCSPVDEKDAEDFVHEEPCIFCRMLESRDSKVLQHRNNNTSTISSPSRRIIRGRRRNNGQMSGNDKSYRYPYSMLADSGLIVDQIITPYLKAPERRLLFKVPEFCEAFQLKDYFCAKHGDRYKSDDQIFRHPPKRKNRHGETIEYVTFGNLLEKMLKDGKDPLVFCDKLDARTRPFPAHKCEDTSINLPEVPLAEDPKYGKYFRRMKKCMKCEKEADARQQAKKGMRKCGTCSRFHHFLKERHCSNCQEFLGCDKCPCKGKNKTPDKCGQCEAEFCSKCREVFSCGSCGASSCDVCLQKADFHFETCSRCNYSYCNNCNYTYYCQLCEHQHCYYCVDGGTLDCQCGKIECCAKCKPQKRCDICWERKCLDCYDMKGKMGCSMCGGSSCKKCDGVYMCEICEQAFCYTCRSQHQNDRPNHICNKCGPMFVEFLRNGTV